MSSLKDTLSRIEDEVAVGRLSAMATFTRLRWIAMDLQREVAELAQQRGDLAASVVELQTSLLRIADAARESPYRAGHVWDDALAKLIARSVEFMRPVNVASDSQPSEQTR